MYSPHHGEAIDVDNIRLATAKEAEPKGATRPPPVSAATIVCLPAPVKTQVYLPETAVARDRDAEDPRSLEQEASGLLRGAQDESEKLIDKYWRQEGEGGMSWRGRRRPPGSERPAMPRKLLFSATMPPVIARLAREILRDPQTVEIGRRSAPAVGMVQAAYPVPEHLKTGLLRHLLRHTEMPSVLVFTRTRRSARRLARHPAAA
jgi:hypothetical protein